MANNSLTLSPIISLKIRLNFSRRLFWFLSVGSVLSLLAIYVFQVSSIAREQYSLRSYQKSIIQLSKTNEMLEMDFSKNNSLANIEKYLLTQNFQKANKIKYIQLIEGQVVKK